MVGITIRRFRTALVIRGACTARNENENGNNKYIYVYTYKRDTNNTRGNME